MNYIICILYIVVAISFVGFIIKTEIKDYKFRKTPTKLGNVVIEGEQTNSNGDKIKIGIRTGI